MTQPTTDPRATTRATPLFGETDPLAALLAWQAAGEQGALATVIATWGSSPRPTGSMMAISAAGAMVGSVSGGCVENAVVELAQTAIATGQAQVADYGISDDVAWAVGLACGGQLEVRVEPFEP